MGTLIFNLNMMKMMKYRLLFLYILGMTVAACNNDLPDELFVKRVVIAENGFQDLRVEYPEDGTVNTQITISISGTSVLSKDVEAQVKVCPDTLDDYNYERFVQDTMLYYTLLPEDCYTLENEGKVTIKKGDEYALLSVQFDLSRLDMFKDYVLPLEVSSVSDYEVGEPKYRKALLNYNTCRMYAGGVYETDTDRDRYVIRVTVNSDSTLSYTAMTPEINLITEGDASQNRISISESPDLLVQNKSVITTTLKMNYSYTYTSPEGYPYHRRFEGTFTNDRTVFRDKDGNIREEW